MLEGLEDNYLIDNSLLGVFVLSEEFILEDLDCDELSGFIDEASQVDLRGVAFSESAEEGVFSVQDGSL